MPQKGYISPNVRMKLDDIYDFVEQYKAEMGYSPSRAELAARFKTSKSVIGFYLRRMVRLGMLDAPRFGIARNLCLVSFQEIKP